MKKKPINTKVEIKSNPIGFLMDAMIKGGDKAILDQEAEGQSSFVESTTLPTKIMSDKGMKILEGWGVVFGEVVEGDPLFQYATLPAGWKKVATDHSMHSDLVDDKGRKRASIFYKAAFYDRSAHMNLNTRYSYHTDYDKSEKENIEVAVVTDGDEVLHTTPPLTPDGQMNSYRVARNEAIEWLNKHFPKWQNPTAYWD